MIGKIIGKLVSRLSLSDQKEVLERLTYNVKFDDASIDVGTKTLATRDAWIESAIKRIPAGLRLLDAGAGEQPYKKFCGHLTYVSQDVGEYNGNGDGRGFQTGDWDFGKLDIICDLASVPEPDGSFGAVLCTEVIEHVPDPVKVLHEIARLTSSGGYLILTAPFCSLTHFAPYHFSTGFNRYFYEKHLLDLGYEIIEITENGNFFEFMAQELRRLKSLSNSYLNTHIDHINRYHLHSILQMLDNFSKQDTKSKELLCFGYFVLARKK